MITLTQPNIEGRSGACKRVMLSRLVALFISLTWIVSLSLGASGSTPPPRTSRCVGYESRRVVAMESTYMARRTSASRTASLTGTGGKECPSSPHEVSPLSARSSRQQTARRRWPAVSDTFSIRIAACRLANPKTITIAEHHRDHQQDPRLRGHGDDAPAERDILPDHLAQDGLVAQPFDCVAEHDDQPRHGEMVEPRFVAPRSKSVRAALLKSCLL